MDSAVKTALTKRRKEMKLICKECENELEFEPLDLDETETIVKPCKFCMEKIENGVSESSYDSGYEAGYDSGVDSGYMEGEQDGHKAGYDEAVEEYKDKIAEAGQEAYDRGYDEARKDYENV
jgi:hypothetical protein